MSDVFINQTSPIQQLEDLKRGSQAKGAENSERFAELLNEALSEVNELQKTSDAEVGKILSGDIKDVHSAMIAMQKADLSFQMVMQVRNKLVEAYQEVMRMQV
ncbi:MAG TPA: flagellar hook-basal body complex protein FliE [Acidobacteriota bacterium]|nr:flagellar hook-basal body complex protein FliE [Acidobacteriota bacterium]